ncbi:MAG: hypothetical protein ACPF89_06425, partial [Pseudohongiellaceae bacterium]
DFRGNSSLQLAWKRPVLWGGGRGIMSTLGRDRLPFTGGCMPLPALIIVSPSMSSCLSAKAGDLTDA